MIITPLTALVVGVLIVGLALALALAVLDRMFPPLRRLEAHQRTAANRLPSVPSVAGPAAATVPAGYVTPEWAAAYWRETVRQVRVMLIFWAILALLPSLLAVTLNRFTIFTGFPLGYYMGAQGTLLGFLLLTFVHAVRMRRLDAAYGLHERVTAAQTRRSRRLIAGYIGFAGGLLAVVAVVDRLQRAWAIPPFWIDWAFLGATLVVYAVIGLRSKTDSLDEYYVAGRNVPGAINGLATGSDWMSAASFMSMAGALFLLGFEGLAYLIGWTGGYVLLILLLVPYLRKFGRFTLPDFIGARYPGHGARVIAAVLSIIICFTYITAQVTGIGIIMSRFLGIDYVLGVAVGLSAVLVCSFLGGMRAITWTQGVQGIILVLAYLLPITWISYRLTGSAVPQIMFGEALRNIALLEELQQISRGYTEAFNDWTAANYIALVICLMLGTAGMPHILVRFYTVSSVQASRSSVGWALLWICLLYLTAPAYAAFARWELLREVVGSPLTALPAWVTDWARSGLLLVADAVGQGGNGDGVLQFGELRIDQDLIVLAAPEIGGLPVTVSALVAAGALAAALSTADGLLMVIGAAAAHDIYHQTLNPRAGLRERLWLGRISMLIAAVLAALTALQRLTIIVQLVSWAFSLAAATIFPILVLGIFSRRTDSRAAVSGMLAGFTVTVSYMVLTSIRPEAELWGIGSTAAGIFGIPVNFLLTWLLSRRAVPSDAQRALVDSIRTP
jgi:cation/acetate symporter